LIPLAESSPERAEGADNDTRSTQSAASSPLGGAFRSLASSAEHRLARAPRSLPPRSTSRRDALRYRSNPMNTLRTVCESDETGTIHVDVPVGSPGRRVVVFVSWGDAPDAWPAGWFASTFGSIQDATFERHAQGQCEVREDLR
jgi:hypothetical protein